MGAAMTGHDLDLEAVCSVSEKGNVRANRDQVRTLIAEVESLRAKLAAAEQEREATATNALRTVNKISDERDRAETVLAAYEKRHNKLRSALSCVHVDLTAQTVAAADLVKILEADAALAAEQDEPDEPKRCEHVYQDGYRCRMPLQEHYRVVGLAEFHGVEPKREQS